MSKINSNISGRRELQLYKVCMLLTWTINVILSDPSWTNMLMRPQRSDISLSKENLLNLSKKKSYYILKETII